MNTIDPEFLAQNLKLSKQITEQVDFISSLSAQSQIVGMTSALQGISAAFAVPKILPGAISFVTQPVVANALTNPIIFQTPSILQLADIAASTKLAASAMQIAERPIDIASVMDQFSEISATIGQLPYSVSVANQIPSITSALQNLQTYIQENPSLLDAVIDTPSEVEETYQNIQQTMESGSLNDQPTPQSELNENLPSKLSIVEVISLISSLMGIYSFLQTQITEETFSILNEILTVILQLLLALQNMIS